ncbi:MAG TPA: leucine-rich repeat domain-containing protein, partial [Oscillospiraceae bacterium]|nr:leucine-rich repeat domain-containing protein [Oscillospiraceae bacterium]
MKKNLKSVLAILLCLQFTFGVFTLAVQAESSESEGTISAKTNSGEDFEIDDGVLVKYNGPGGHVVVPAGVTSIGELAFDNCSDLTSVELPNGITSIGDGAFAGCESLESISLPSSLTNIGEGAFAGCVSLQSISLPSGLTSIGEGAFRE